jgi:Putative peptidoglycan binding domain
MGMKAKLSLGALAVGIMVVSGLAYWVAGQNSHLVAPAGAPSPSQLSALPAPPSTTAASPATTPVTNQPSQSAPPPAPPSTTAASPATPLVTNQPSQSAPPPAAAPPAPAVVPLPAEAAMSEADRREVQEALHRLRYYQGPVDGIFGPLTRTAIRRFQHDIGVETAGYLTEEEANRLVAIH